jgi:catechol 2,3-dioxygenase-like lactoylglutathione lyase family enzyme
MSDDPAQRQALEMTEPGETSTDPVTGTLDDVGDLQVGAAVVSTQDMPRAVRFWSRALGYRPSQNHPSQNHPSQNHPSQDHPDQTGPDPEVMMLDDPAGTRPSFSVQRAGREAGEPGTVDLFTAEPERQIERLVGLGAVRASDDSQHLTDFAVLRDPDGNEFRVLSRRSA